MPNPKYLQLWSPSNPTPRAHRAAACCIALLLLRVHVALWDFSLPSPSRYACSGGLGASPTKTLGWFSDVNQQSAVIFHRPSIQWLACLFSAQGCMMTAFSDGAL